MMRFFDSLSPYQSDRYTTGLVMLMSNLRKAHERPFTTDGFRCIFRLRMTFKCHINHAATTGHVRSALDLLIGRLLPIDIVKSVCIRTDRADKRVTPLSLISTVTRNNMFKRKIHVSTVIIYKDIDFKIKTA